MLKSFEEHPTRSAAILAGVTPLTGLGEPTIFQSLLRILFSDVNDDKNIRRTWIFQGFADALTYAKPELLTNDTLRTVLGNCILLFY